MRFDQTDPIAQIRGQRLALRTAHRQQFGERLVEGGKEQSLDLLALDLTRLNAKNSR